MPVPGRATRSGHPGARDAPAVTGRAGPLAALVVIGALWGLSQPLTKIAVSTGHGALGLVFWQLVIGAVLLTAVCAMRGRLPRPSAARLRVWLVIAMIGTVLPNAASYNAAVHLPSGVLSLTLSTVPMFAFPVALALGQDRFSATRLAGLLCGLLGVAMVALPGSSLPQPGMAAFVPLALVAPFFYGFEGNVIARWGTAGMDGIEVLAGASVVGAVVALPMALATGQWVAPVWPPGPPGQALLASSTIHATVYAAYIWLVGRAGPVFAAQVSYLVTGFGLVWAMLLLGESYSGWIWAAGAAMFVGLMMVQPRPADPRPA